ncbi:Ribosome recycling factor, putative [Perkinsus marinus ATCC 50983]|uniref:Ribosome recycling factor, putative n=1 Tax=Perkinsus marinus (strain ATCC 50983 / TXsc) TaxID=423536 RepID=C5K7P2_PERM5|nr:Ribosome recycling factor, putative [Perkinsus marinus ATCC 50983]EER19577.1 Ribosome recycling factor, putative [Perkinsus marinus ATCC 50983]|eukprot:XP_002787781.1 Ribosome recycling factor, putative [Perkinsus marinus ATCC 50983]
MTPAERRQQRLDQKMDHAKMLKEQTQALDEEVRDMKAALQEVQMEQASPELFRSITVAEKPLLNISQMSILNATTVNFSVFDDGLAGACQKAIQLRGKNWTVNKDGNKISVVLPKVTREVRNECLNRCKGILKKYQRNINSIRATMLEENRRMMPSTEMEKTEAAKIDKIYKQRADQLVVLLREKEQALSKAT